MTIAIFCIRKRADIDEDAFQSEFFQMLERVGDDPKFGFLEVKVYTAADGEIVLVAKFASEGGLRAWRDDHEHKVTMERGRTDYFESYWGGEADLWYRFDRMTGRQVFSTDSTL
jgi:heme-degrading monooxygenase HmoA